MTAGARRIRLTGGGGLVAGIGTVSAAAAMASNHRQLLAIALGMGLAIAAAGATAIAAGGVRVVDMTVPARATEADPIAVTVSLGGGRRWPRGLRHLIVPVDARDHHRAPAPLATGGSGPHREEVLSGLRRGRHVVGPARVVVTDHLGLVSCSSRGGPAHEIVVHPRRHALSVGHPGTGPRHRHGGARPDAHRGERHQLRDHVAGDDARLIHWPASLRLDRLVVRDRAPVTGPHPVVLLDVRPDAYEHPARFEDAVRVAASLLDAHVRTGSIVEIRTGAGHVATVSGRGGGYLDALDRLAEVDLSPAGGEGRCSAPGADRDPGHRQPVHVVTGTTAAAPEPIARRGVVAVLALGTGAPPVVDAGVAVIVGGSDAELVRRWNETVGG